MPTAPENRGIRLFLLLCVGLLAACVGANPRFSRATAEDAGARAETRPVEAGHGEPAERDGGDDSDPQDAHEAPGDDGGPPELAPTDTGPRETAPDAPPQPDANGLVGHWELDEGPGIATIADRSGNQNHGTVATPIDAAWRPGRVRWALNVPEADGAGAVIASSRSIDEAAGAFTLAAWVNRNRPSQGSRNTAVISRQYGTGNRELYALTFQYDRMMLWLYTEPPAANVSLQSNRVVPSTTWVHVAATWDGQTVRLFLGGDEVGSRGFSARLPPSPNPLLIGNNANSSGIDQPLDGLVDDVRLYDRALPRAAILALIAAADDP